MLTLLTEVPVRFTAETKTCAAWHTERNLSMGKGGDKIVTDETPAKRFISTNNLTLFSG